VDIEQETMNYLQNQMNYTLMTQSMSAQFNRVNLVLR
jgi:flagellar basal-body rod protein FlgB